MFPTILCFYANVLNEKDVVIHHELDFTNVILVAMVAISKLLLVTV